MGDRRPRRAAQEGHRRAVPRPPPGRRLARPERRRLRGRGGGRHPPRPGRGHRRDGRRRPRARFGDRWRGSSTPAPTPTSGRSPSGGSASGRTSSTCGRPQPDELRVSLADKLYNASSIEWDLRMRGDDLWRVFGSGRDGQIWYYRSLADIFLERAPGPMADELDRVAAPNRGGRRREPGRDRGARARRAAAAEPAREAERALDRPGARARRCALDEHGCARRARSSSPGASGPSRPGADLGEMQEAGAAEALAYYRDTGGVYDRIAALPAADDRGDPRLVPGRRVRDGAGLRLSDRRLGGDVRAAGGRDRHPAELRRHHAAREGDRRRAGQGADPPAAAAAGGEPGRDGPRERGRRRRPGAARARRRGRAGGAPAARGRAGEEGRRRAPRTPPARRRF